eukprot:Nitzschia sp. Nitz4//scaffold178_size73299//70555//72588//NITZ4_005723-RA/size73299-processed-gene-0.35-mRNA-1//1//CDS//3329539194//5653//frame0
MNSIRSVAQDVGSWYFVHLDSFTPNQDNVERFLRGPLMALTVTIVLPELTPMQRRPKAPPAGDQTAQGSHKKKIILPSSSASSGEILGDWREFVVAPGSANRTEATVDGKAAYDKLSRRTRVRMEAFLAGCALAVPNDNDPNNHSISQQPSGDLVTLQQGLTGFSRASDRNVRGLHGLSMAQSANSTAQRPQMDEEELVHRLEIYIRTLQRVQKLNDECVIAMEPPKTLRTRACMTTDAFVATAGTIRNLRPVLSRLLHCLTMEVLAVEVLSPDIHKVIHRIVSEYEHGTSFASLAFLSTPEVNADSLLTPLIIKYLKHLQSNWEDLISSCELERMLTRALDPDIRNLFKTVEFRSIGHLLEVCHEHRNHLHKIELAPNVCAIADNISSLIHSRDALRQALRDLQREVITVNGQPLPPVTSRKELLNLLAQTLNSRTLTAAERPKRRSRKKRAGIDPLSSASEHDDTENESDIVFSETEPDSSMDEGPAPNKENNQAEEPASRKVRRRNFHVSTIDLLTRRLLIAASRTGNGGDAYFVVRDLFGGEEVEVVPTDTHAAGRSIGTIDILVRLASVTIRCHQSFDVYPKSMVRECEPLIQFHTTTSETISLQEVRANGETTAAPASEASTPSSTTVDADAGVGNATMVLQELESPRTGWRTLSIRPAIYEKVEIWGTPS